MELAIVGRMREGEVATWSGELSVIKLIIPPVHDTVLRHGSREHWCPGLASYWLMSTEGELSLAGRPDSLIVYCQAWGNNYEWYSVVRAGAGAGAVTIVMKIKEGRWPAGQ